MPHTHACAALRRVERYRSRPLRRRLAATAPRFPRKVLALASVFSPIFLASVFLLPDAPPLTFYLASLSTHPLPCCFWTPAARLFPSRRPPLAFFPSRRPPLAFSLPDARRSPFSFQTPPLAFFLPDAASRLLPSRRRLSPSSFQTPAARLFPSRRPPLALFPSRRPPPTASASRPDAPRAWMCHWALTSVPCLSSPVRAACGATTSTPPPRAPSPPSSARGSTCSSERPSMPGRGRCSLRRCTPQGSVRGVVVILFRSQVRHSRGLCARSRQARREGVGMRAASSRPWGGCFACRSSHGGCAGGHPRPVARRQRYGRAGGQEAGVRPRRDPRGGCSVSRCVCVAVVCVRLARAGQCRPCVVGRRAKCASCAPPAGAGSGSRGCGWGGRVSCARALPFPRERARRVQQGVRPG